MKYSSKIRKMSIVILSVMVVMLTITTINTVVLAKEIKEEIVTPRLNSKISFEGKTYLFSNSDTVRREYKNGERGIGIISIISKKAKHQVYVTGEGWIDAKQIKEIQNYITIEFKQNDGGKSIGASLKIDGEFVTVESENTGVLDYHEGNLTAKGNGETIVNIVTKEGKKIEALATVVDGTVTLDIPEKDLGAELKTTANVANNKITVKAEGDAQAKLEIGNEGVGVAGEGNGNVTLNAGDAKIASADGKSTGSATLKKAGTEVNVNNKANLGLFERLMMKITGSANAGLDINGTHAEAKGNATAELEGKDIASANGGAHANINKQGMNAGAEGNVNVYENKIVNGGVDIAHNVGEIDPKADINVQISGKDVIDKQDLLLPIYSTFLAMIKSKGMAY